MSQGIVWAPYVPLYTNDIIPIDYKEDKQQSLNLNYALIKLMLKEIYYKHCLGNNFNFKKSELESRYQKTIFNSNFYTTIKIENNE